MKRTRAFALIGLMGLVVLAAVAWRAFTPAPLVQGVDVSHHQGAIDWPKLARDDVHFAYIKATEGGNHIDPRFQSNWRAARAAGIYVGGYHFFTLCRDGETQAAHFAAILPKPSPGALPPAVDLEHMGPCRKGPQISDVPGEIRRFLAAMERAHGIRPILYTTREFHDAYLKSFSGERFWLRSLFRRPSFRQKEWVIWQHHHRGVKQGVSGPIDLNAFRGDLPALQAFAASPKTVAILSSSQSKAPTR
jgi:lysozyme